MAVLYRCHQCSYEEWREADQEIWLCLVCGWMLWSVVAEEDAGAELTMPVPADDAEDDDEGVPG